MMHQQTIAEHQLAWGLGELTGGAPAPDLSAKILAALADTRRRRPITSTQVWRGAAALVLGVGTVVAVAVWPRDEGRQQAQAPVQAETQAPAAAQDPLPAPVQVRIAAEIAALPRATRNVLGPGLDDSEIEALVARCPDLESLSFGGWKARPKPLVTDAGMAHIGRLHKLRALDLTFAAGVTSEGLAHLEHLPLLQSLGLGAIALQDVDLTRLARLPALKELDLGVNPAFRDKHLETVLALTGLRRLRLAGCSMLSTAKLARLTELTELSDLDLNDVHGKPPTRRGVRRTEPGHGVTDGTLMALAKLPKLASLRVAGCEITDEGVRALAQAPSLTALDLSRTDVGDDALRAVLGARSLRSLRVRSCRRISDEIVADLLRETTLEQLDVSQLAWMHDGHRDALAKLPAMRTLAATARQTIRFR